MAKQKKRTTVIRTVKNGQVSIDGVTYRYDEDVSKLEGKRYVFGLYSKAQGRAHVTDKDSPHHGKLFIHLMGSPEHLENPQPDDDLELRNDLGVLAYAWWYEV